MIFTFYHDHDFLKQATFHIFLPCDLYLIRLLVSTMFLPVVDRYLENLDILSGITQDITCKILRISKIVIFEMILSLDFKIMRSGHIIFGGDKKFENLISK